MNIKICIPQYPTMGSIIVMFVPPSIGGANIRSIQVTIAFRSVEHTLRECTKCFARMSHTGIFDRIFMPQKAILLFLG